VLLQDQRVILAALIARDPGRAAELRKRTGIEPATKPSMHVVLTWETDANDVDLHVRDRKGNESWYGHLELDSGGSLLHDMTDGYGPEMFEVDNPKAFPYSVSAHYYRKGPMGVGLGSVQIIRHDGRGNVTVEDRPFAIQNDNATVELGAIR
jgi:hypothetical protein